VSRFGSENRYRKPELGTTKTIGRYLALVNYNVNPITSAMFITATAPNPLLVALIAQATGSSIHITWGQWALAALVPCLCMLLVMPHYAPVRKPVLLSRIWVWGAVANGLMPPLMLW
jgi:di/tricarboxylate transporter